MRWRTSNTGLVERFAASRGMPDAGPLLRYLGVVEVDSDHVGFTYHDPDTRLPCRVKVRGVSRKSFYVEPRSNPAEPDRKALAPLYLVHRCRPLGLASLEPVIITEGEPDALAMIYRRFRNVASLPDGSESVQTADLTPLFGLFNVWLCALDDDEAGHKAFVYLRERARAYGTDAVRVLWRREREDDVLSYKDSNDALRAGFDWEAFRHCLDVCMLDRLGLSYPWDRARRARRSAVAEVSNG